MRRGAREAGEKIRNSPGTKVQFQQIVNPVNTFMLPSVHLPTQKLEQLLKTVSRIPLCQPSQRMEHRFIVPSIGLIRYTVLLSDNILNS